MSVRCKTCWESLCIAAASVVYFDQCLGAAPSKCWSKYAVSTFFVHNCTENLIFLKIKPLTSVLFKPKNLIFFAKFGINFLAFFSYSIFPQICWAVAILCVIDIVDLKKEISAS